jgi:tetratricopeptide (TPR) repeat protein
MAFHKPDKRGKKKVEVENYYKILGTRANATQDTIKKKYIESIRKYPPETHPEQFQQIRRAYETLRDPHKRGEYDLQRKYGGKLEALLDEALELSEQGEWKKAAELYGKILNIDSRSIPALLGIGHAALHTETDQTVDEYLDRAFEYSDSEESKLQIRISQARLLYVHDMSIQALEVLDQIKASFPEAIERNFSLYCDVYMDLGRREEAWALMYSHIPAVDDQEHADIGIFMDWINLMIRLEKWNVYSKVQQRVRKFLKFLPDEEERQAALYHLMDEYNEYWDAGRFREALVFIEFAHYLDSKDEDIKHELREARELTSVEKEIDRMVQDREMFPLITMHAIEWFYEEFLHEEALYSFRNSIPAPLMEQLDTDNEGHAFGISRLKKKFPLLYRYFKEAWDDMYLQRTASLNREQRRRIR